MKRSGPIGHDFDKITISRGLERRRVGGDDFREGLVVREVLGCPPRCVPRRHVAPESEQLLYKIMQRFR